MREGTFGEEEKSIHWEFNKQNETNFDIILSWGQKEISRVKNLTRKEARIALNGLRVFYDTINAADPDFTHPDICKCFNITAKKYKLDPVEVPKKLDRNLHRHPFAGVIGDLRDFKNNLLAKEVLKVQELVHFTQDFLEIVDLPSRKREPKYRISSTPLQSQPMKILHLITMLNSFLLMNSYNQRVTFPFIEPRWLLLLLEVG